jgi:sugar lactone lactonase YvrE
MEQLVRFIVYIVTLLVIVILSAYVFAVGAKAQAIDQGLRPDLNRVRSARQQVLIGRGRKGGYRPEQTQLQKRSRQALEGSSSTRGARLNRMDLSIQATAAIAPGTHLSRILHTSQFDLNSPAGTNEQFVDRNSDLMADERTTFDFEGGSFDIAVGNSGARYEVYSATRNGTLVGVLVVAVDTNGDYLADSSTTYDLQRDFSLTSAASVVTGTSNSGREFVIVCSSGYFNAEDANDPRNEESPGIVLLVRDSSTGGFDNSLSRELVQLGDNRLYNANGLALLPNNDLLIADFTSDELRIIRDTDADGMPDTLDTTPYYSFRFADDTPLDIAVNSRGVVFSHSAGDDTLMLAVYDDNGDGRGDRDEVVVEGLSIDNNLFLHGLTVDRLGNVYVIEDSLGMSDGTGGNGGTPQVDAFPDGGMNGFLQNGKIFTTADSAGLAVSGLSFAPVSNPINDSQYFVRQQYLDFLGREPDAGGLGYWTSQITGCGSDARCINSRRIGVSAAFFIELEFQDTGSFVYRLYRGSLGRRPSFSEFAADRSSIVAGSNLEMNKQALANAWVLRPAFLQIYPLSQTPEQFVDTLFEKAGLAPFTAERQQLANDMRNGKTRAQVLREVIEIGAFKVREYNPAFVLMQYFGYLNRDPDQGGYDFWLNVLNNQEPNNYRGMVCSFITSREYQERFGLLLRRTNTDCAE